MHTLTSEAAREREILRYLPPELFQNAGGERPSSYDKSLTAFAQLGAIRMNAKRGVISLSTRKKKWFIAEAGQTLSLQDDNRHAEGDHLWFGAGEDFSDTGVKFYNDYLDTALRSGVEDDYIHISDVHAHSRYAEADPNMCKSLRSIIGFPLRSPLGTVIGLYGMIYDVPREPLRECEIVFMADMAKTVVDHLVAGSTKRKQYRAERMVKGMGLFVEGKSTLRDWWLQKAHDIKRPNPKTNGAELLVKQADAEFGIQEPSRRINERDLLGLQNVRPRVDFEDRPASVTSGGASVADESIAERPRPRRSESIYSEGTDDNAGGRPRPGREESIYSSTTGKDSEPAAPVFTSEGGRSASYQSTADTTVDSTMGRQDIDPTPESPDGLNSGKRLQEALLSADLKNVFSRASNLIREAISLDGAVFFDASIGSFGGGSKKTNANNAPTVFNLNGVLNGVNNENEHTSSSEDDQRKRAAEKQDSETPYTHDETEGEKHCSILGFSTRSRSSVNLHDPPEELLYCQEDFLHKLLKRYPHGKVFSFDESGEVSSTEEVDMCGQNIPLVRPPPIKLTGKKKMSKEAEIAALLALLPGARSAAFFPLWDSAKERWFAGSLIWSTKPTRPLCPTEDMTYMAAFGNSIMAEVARLSAVVAGQMKTDFISSISHELRSPLHGVLASVEFLQDTVMTEAQIDMVDTIQACGKTLLDTINHVLDFAKINKTLKSKPKKRKKGLPGKKSGTAHSEPQRDYFDTAQMERVEAEDICVLSEEVVNSIYAGHNLGRRQREGSEIHIRPDAQISESKQVVVIMDVDWRPTWTYEMDAGAWRRILMNLFSNAMKYTQSGYIRIQLKTEDGPAIRGQRQQSMLSLIVSDSGKGISQEFLRHHLYTPFAQEDALAAGTGLGLSIVRQIITDLGGSIDFTSEQGSGTEARVMLPLSGLTWPNQPLGHGDIVSCVREATKGLKACLVAFDIYPDIVDTPTGILSAEAESMIFLKSSIASLFSDWFHMDVAMCASLESANGDILVMKESTIRGLTVEEQVQALSGRRIVLVLCGGPPQGSNFVTKEGLQVFFVQQPFGPHKMANLLRTALMDRPKADSKNIQNGVVKPQTPLIIEPLPTPELATKIATHDFAPVFIVPPKSELKNTPITTTKTATVTTTALPRPSIASNPSLITNASISSLSTVSTDSSDARRILLVEDNEINLKILITYMRKLKLSHATAINGLEALKAYVQAGGAFDVIFMDISMPIMDGLTASRKIREWEGSDERNQDTGGLGTCAPAAIIALTGAASMSARQEAFSSGIDLFLTKPVPMRNLKSILEDLRIRGREGLAE